MGMPIRVIASRPGEKMDPLARIDYLRPYTVDHNVKVYDFGKIDETDQWKFISQWNKAWGITETPETMHPVPSTPLSPSLLATSIEVSSSPHTPSTQPFKSRSRDTVNELSQPDGDLNSAHLFQKEEKHSVPMPYPVNTAPKHQPSDRAMAKPLVEPSIVGFSDSGYASLPRQTEKQISRSRGINESLTSTAVHQGDPQQNNGSDTEGDRCEMDDGGSIYSITSSMTDAEAYISELVQSLTGSIPTVRDAADDAAIARLYTSLPHLLKSFAQKIGCSSRREAWEVRVFVNKHRRYVFGALLFCTFNEYLLMSIGNDCCTVIGVSNGRIHTLGLLLYSGRMAS